jgi:hypothetical protein
MIPKRGGGSQPVTGRFPGIGFGAGAGGRGVAVVVGVGVGVGVGRPITIPTSVVVLAVPGPSSVETSGGAAAAGVVANTAVMATRTDSAAERCNVCELRKDLAKVGNMSRPSPWRRSTRPAGMLQRVARDR